MFDETKFHQLVSLYTKRHRLVAQKPIKKEDDADEASSKEGKGKTKKTKAAAGKRRESITLATSACWVGMGESEKGGKAKSEAKSYGDWSKNEEVISEVLVVVRFNGCLLLHSRLRFC